MQRSNLPHLFEFKLVNERAVCIIKYINVNIYILHSVEEGFYLFLHRNRF